MRNYDDVAQFGWSGFAESALPAGGSVFYVDGNSGNAANTSSEGQGDSWDLPFANINYAISRCSNDAGNVIIVAADHTEGITSTGTVSGTTTTQLVVDKSGITIIGLGTSDRRPTITFSGAVTAEMYISSPECTLKNLLFKSAIIDLETAIEATADADGLHIENCEFRDGGASLEMMDSISLAAACDDVVIRGCRFITSSGGTSTKSAILMTGASDRIVIQDNFFWGDWGGAGTAVIEGGTAESESILIDNNTIYNIDATKGEGVTMHGDTTGAVTNNLIYSTNAASSPLQAAKCLKANNKITSVLAVEAEKQGSSGAIANGNNFYVDSGTGVDTATGLSWHDPLATIDAAIGKCNHDYGDTIHVAAGHAESLTGASTYIWDMDTRGVKVIGYGSGDIRPTITFTTTAATAHVDVTAADCTIENFLFKCNITQQLYMIHVHTAAQDTTIRNCEFINGGQTPLSVITNGDGTGDNEADNMIVEGCRIYFPGEDQQDNAIEIKNDVDGVRIRNNYMQMGADEAVIEVISTGNNCQDLQITDNVIISEASGVHCIEIDVAAQTVTGICARNTLVCDTRTAAAQTNMMSCHDNTWIDLSGIVAPVQLNNPAVAPGVKIYVDSALGVDDAAHGHCWEEPLATVDHAVAFCSANNGDEIHVAPGHSETLSDAATGLALDVNGVSIIGHGEGHNRSKFLIDTETAEAAPILITGTDCLIKNFNFEGNKTGGTPKGAVQIKASGTTLEDCLFYESVNSKELAITDGYGALLLDDSAAAIANITIKNCVFDLAPGGNDESAISAIDGTNGITNLKILGCYISGEFTDGAIQLDVGADSITYVTVKDCTIINLDAVGLAGACIQMDSGAIWFLINNQFVTGDADAAPVTDYSASYLVNNHSCESGAYSANTLMGSVTNHGA